MIAARDLVVRYPRATRAAVDGVSLTAERGGLTALVGPNGSGKSTVVGTLIGRIAPESGALLVDGVDVRSIERRALARRVAVVTQREERTFPATAREYVSLGRFPHLGDWRASQSIDRQAVEAAAERASVTALLDRDLDALSGGEWQRVRIARALAQDAEALVLDEPTTFLDVGHEMAVFELLYQASRSGMAVLLVSHQLNLVARFADQIVLLHQGRVAAAGTRDDVMQAQLLERVYEWPLVVTRDPAVGAPALLPLRAHGRR